MKCEAMHELMPELAAGQAAMTPEIGGHLAGCHACMGKLEEFRQTMALLDEWPAPEPSQYFDVRLQARLREELARPQPGWLGWLRRPVLAAALTVLLAVGAGLFIKNANFSQSGNNTVATVDQQMSSGPGTAVSDLQSLDKNHDLYADFDLLDDLEVQHDVQANP